MNTKLLQFQANFRSVLDSGISTVNNYSCRVGTNVSGDYPFVLLPADSYGLRWQQKLADGHYGGHPERLISVGNFSGVSPATIEDLMPTQSSVHQTVSGSAYRRFRRPAKPGLAHQWAGLFEQFSANRQTYNVA